MRKTALVLASMALAVLLASGMVAAQTIPPENLYYEFSDKWPVPDSPLRIAVDSQDNVYVPTLLDGIQKFTPEGTLLKEWSVCCPTGGIAVDSRDRIYVASGGGGACGRIARVQKFTSNGRLLTQWGTPGTGDNQFCDPVGVAVDSHDNVYVVDGYPAARIMKFTSEGTFITKWGSPGDGDGQFEGPGDVAVDSQDNVYVVDSGTIIQKFTSEGAFVKEWGGFTTAGGIGTDSHDNVYVSDYSDDSVRRFTSEGELVTKWGSPGDGDGQFDTPGDVAVDSQGFAYVSDFWNNRVQKFAEAEDTVAPITRAFFQSNRFGWVNHDVRVNLQADDEGVGAKEITYETTGAQQASATTVPGTSTPVEIVTEGKTTITYYATDRAGNIEQPAKSTIVRVDKTPPQVESTAPFDNATRVPRGVVVEASFTEAMDPSRLNGPNLRLGRLRLYEEGSTTPLAATVTYDRRARKAILDPEARLKRGVTYTAHVYPAAWDLAYNRLDQDPSVEGNQGKRWHFTVGS